MAGLLSCAEQLTGRNLLLFHPADEGKHRKHLLLSHKEICRIHQSSDNICSQKLHKLCGAAGIVISP